MLHKFHDGSVLKTMSAKYLVKIPIWKGNRILDKEHVNKIREAISSNVNLLDSGYRIVNYNELNTSGVMVRQSYLIDGQHRAEVLREHFLSSLCEPDFQVIVTEKDVESETDAIEYFNAINNVKPQQWQADPAIIVNNYIVELEKRFNTKKQPFIRPSATMRPYLGVDKLRDALKTIVKHLGQDKASIEKFVQKVVDKNKELLDKSSLLILANDKYSPYYEKGAKIGFMLAVKPSLPWIKELVQ